MIATGFTTAGVPAPVSIEENGNSRCYVRYVGMQPAFTLNVTYIKIE